MRFIAEDEHVRASNARTWCKRILKGEMFKFQQNAMNGQSSSFRSRNRLIEKCCFVVIETVSSLLRRGFAVSMVCRYECQICRRATCPGQNKYSKQRTGVKSEVNRRSTSRGRASSDMKRSQRPRILSLAVGPFVSSNNIRYSFPELVFTNWQGRGSE